MVSVGERSGGGELIAILGAGSLGRLWAALLPSGYCGFLPRISNDLPEHEFGLGGASAVRRGLPKHAVNTSLYALFRHPWLHKVSGAPA